MMAWLGWGAAVGLLLVRLLERRRQSKGGSGGITIYAPGHDDCPDDCECKWYPPGCVVNHKVGKILTKGWTQEWAEECPHHGVSP